MKPHHFEKLHAAGSCAVGCGHEHTMVIDAAVCKSVNVGRAYMLPGELLDDPGCLPAVFRIRKGETPGIEMPRKDIEKFTAVTAAAIKYHLEAGAEPLKSEPHKIVAVSESDTVHYELLRRAGSTVAATGCGHKHKNPWIAARCAAHHRHLYTVGWTVELPAVFRIHQDGDGLPTGLDVHIDNKTWTRYLELANIKGVEPPDAKTMIDAFRAIEQGRDDDDDLPDAISRMISI